MVDKPASAVQMPAADSGAPQVSPPTQGASRFVVMVLANEVLLTVGQSRVGFNQQTGSPLNAPGAEWFATFSMSATAAKQLLTQLEDALGTYVTKFGAIPMDPAGKLMTAPISGSRAPKASR